MHKDAPHHWMYQPSDIWPLEAPKIVGFSTYTTEGVFAAARVIVHRLRTHRPKPKPVDFPEVVNDRGRFIIDSETRGPPRSIRSPLAVPILAKVCACPQVYGCAVTTSHYCEETRIARRCGAKDRISYRFGCHCCAKYRCGSLWMAGWFTLTTNRVQSNYT